MDLIRRREKGGWKASSPSKEKPKAKKETVNPST